jgi:hypothetical protein
MVLEAESSNPDLKAANAGASTRGAQRLQPKAPMPQMPSGAPSYLFSWLLCLFWTDSPRFPHSPEEESVHSPSRGNGVQTDQFHRGRWPGLKMIPPATFTLWPLRRSLRTAPTWASASSASTRNRRRSSPAARVDRTAAWRTSPASSRRQWRNGRTEATRCGGSARRAGRISRGPGRWSTLKDQLRLFRANARPLAPPLIAPWTDGCFGSCPLASFEGIVDHSRVRGGSCPIFAHVLTRTNEEPHSTGTYRIHGLKWGTA